MEVDASPIEVVTGCGKEVVGFSWRSYLLCGGLSFRWTLNWLTSLSFFSFYAPIKVGSFSVEVVPKLALEDESRKRKTLKLVAGVEGVDSVAVEMKKKKITVIRNVAVEICLCKVVKRRACERGRW
ncbi:hypothetical protein SUGI_0396200 [Cryptomeria japonica]|nr:hypothetical protein SUGI_0396200 [Cryptomeria japonica]